MKVRNVWATAREIAATGEVVEPGKAVTVSKALGVGLCEQSDVWQEVKSKAVEADSDSEES